jgi:hypothetical protein
VMAGLAFAAGAFAAWRLRGHAAILGLALMMALFLNAARVAMIAFDPYLGSHALAVALREAPRGRVIVDNQYYAFSSVFFYADLKDALLLNGRVNNLEYGSYAPGAPPVFIDDADFGPLWMSPERMYLLVEKPAVARIETLAAGASLHLVKESGGKFLFVNQAP